MITEDQLVASWYRTKANIAWRVFHLTKSSSTASEILAETFCRAWDKRDQWVPTENNTTPDNWLYRMASNITYDYLKSARVRHERLMSIIFEIDQPSYDPMLAVDDQIDREKMPTVEDMISCCTGLQKAVLRLRYQHEMPYARIAEIIGSGEHECKSLAFRGIRAIRRNLKK